MSEYNLLDAEELINKLRAATKFLTKSEREIINVEIQNVSELLKKNNISIAFFAPFNSGKSTLINALLGQPILPIGVTHTTSHPIVVKYGDKLKTSVIDKSGVEQTFEGNSILNSVAVFGKQKNKVDVSLIEVFVPQLKALGDVELLDLPGTEDQEVLNQTVKNYLMKADIVVQIINAKQLLSKEEREKIKDWLLARGINSIVFALNFTNLISIAEKKLILKEAKSLTKFYKTDIPAGLNKLYLVNALPALKAVYNPPYSYKNIFQTGLIPFEVGLMTLLFFYRKRIKEKRFLRCILIAFRLKELLETQANDLRKEIDIFERKRNQEIQSGLSLEKTLRKDFKTTVDDLSQWLSYNNLHSAYQSDLAEALENSNAESWEKKTIVKTYKIKASNINDVATRITETYGTVKVVLKKTSVPDPEIDWPDKPTFTFFQQVFSIFTTTKERKWKAYHEERARAVQKGARDYLYTFSQKGLENLNAFVDTITPCICYTPPQIPRDILQKKQYYEELSKTLNFLYDITSIRMASIKNVGVFKTTFYYILMLINLHYRYLIKESSNAPTQKP